MNILDFMVQSVRKSQKLLIWGIATLALLMLFSVTVLPYIIKHQAEKQIQVITGRKASIAGITFNPFGMTLTINGFNFLEPDNSSSFVTFDRLTVSLSSMTVFRFAPVVDYFLLENPKILLVRTAPNRYNFSDIQDRILDTPKTEKPGKNHFSINNISITGGSIDFSDRAARVPRNHTVRDLHLDIPFISNIPYLAEKYTDPRFSALIDGGPLSFSGKAKPLAQAVEASLQLKLDKLDLPHYQPYIPGDLPIKIAKGNLTLDLDLTYRVYKDKQPEFIIKGLTKLDSVDLKEKNGTDIFSFRLFEAVAKEIEPFSRKAAFEKIALHDPTISVSRDSKGMLNLQRLMPKPQNSDDKKRGSGKSAVRDKSPDLKFTAAALLLKNGAVHFHDRLPPGGFSAGLSAIVLEVKNFSTIPGEKSGYILSMQGDKQEALSASGSAVVTPLAANCDFSLAGLELQRGWPYLQHFLSAPVKGVLELKGKADYSIAEGLALTETSATLTNIEAVYGNKDKTSLSKVAVKKASFSQQQNRAEVESFTIGKGKVHLSREADGKLSPLLFLKQTDAAPKGQSGQQQKANTQVNRPLEYLVKEIQVDGLGISFKDRMMESEPSFSLEDIRIKTGNLKGPKLATMPLQFSAKYGGNAPIRIAGSVYPQPFHYKGKVDFSRLPIRDFEDYLPDNINLFFVAGTLDSSLKLDISIPAGGRPLGSFSGNAGVRGFHVVDTAMEEDLMKWESLQMDHISGKLEPFSLAVRQIALNGVYSRIAVRKDRTLNLQNLLKKQGPGAGGQGPEKEKVEKQRQGSGVKGQEIKEQETKGQITIDALTIQDGTLVFSDAHLPQQFKTTFHNLGGRVSGLSSDMNTRAEVDLRGSLENQSPLQITGKVNPLRDDLFVDLTISFKDIELSPATHYSGTYLGYTINRGKLFLDLKYHIENRELTSENKIFVDQFTFGDSVESDKATKMPVRLGVALLKDRKGQIHLDLPVTGRTDDPQFSIWGVVWKVVTNLFVKAVTSPFSLLASMIGSSEDLSAVNFSPGSSLLAPSEEKKLATLAKALADRPGLKVEIIGFIDKDKDPDGYRAELLLKKMRQEKYLELVKNRQIAEGAQADLLDIRPEESSRLLKQVYLKEKFPKPRNMIGMLKDLPDAEMRKLIIANTLVGSTELHQLATQRSVAVQQYLMVKGGMDSQRLFQKRDDIFKVPKEAKGALSRVELNPIAQ